MTVPLSLELLCLPHGGVAVELHLREPGTPGLRHFASPLLASRAQEALQEDRSSSPRSSTRIDSCGAAIEAAADEAAAADGDAPAAPAAPHPACSPAAEAAEPLPGAAGEQQQSGMAEASAASTAAAAVAEPGASGGSSAASLDAVMGMLQQLLSSSAAQQQQQQQQQLQPTPATPTPRPPPAPPAAPAPPRLEPSRAAAPLPGGVEKLLALELEVVQLQQALQIAQLEFEARTVQLHSLKQRADEAEQRAQAAEERAASSAQQAHAAEKQLGELRGQLSDAASRQAQQATQHAEQLAAATASQRAAEGEAARLQQLLAAAQAAAELEAGAAREAAERERALLQREAAGDTLREQGALREQLAALECDHRQLWVHVTEACSVLDALGIPAHQVFSAAALAAVGLGGAGAGAVRPPSGSPPAAAQQPAGDEPAPAGAQRPQQQLAAAAPPPPPPPPPLAHHGQQACAPRPPPPQVPRLQLSCISLEELQQAVSGGAVTTPSSAAGLPPLPGNLHSGTSAQLQASQQAHMRGLVGSPAGQSRLASPAGSVACSTGGALPLTARRAPPVSPAAAELLATARAWQLTARSAAAAEQDENGGHIPAYRPAGAAPVTMPGGGGGHTSARLPYGAGTAKPAPLRAVQTARGRPPAAGAAKQGLRWTYGQDPGFREVAKAYRAVVASEAGSSEARWAKSVFSSSSAIDTDPRRVEAVVQGLLQLFRENGVAVPLQRSAPCQYRLGSARLAVRLVNGRLMARAGAGQTVDVLAWLEKQPVPA